MRVSTYIAPLIIAMAPSFASAQGVAIDGAVTLGFNLNDIDVGVPGVDLSLNGYSIDFEGDLIFSESFEVGLGFSFGSGDLDIGGLGASANIDLIGLSIEPVYMHSSGAYFGAYFRTGDLDLALLGPLTIGIDTSQYGIFGGYDFGTGHVELFFGESDVSSSALIPIPLGVDVSDFGVSAAFDAMDNLEVFGSFIRTEIDGGGGFSLPITSVSIGLEYDINSDFSVYGAFGQSEIGLTDIGAPSDATATGFTLGLSYDLRSSTSAPVILSAEFSRTTLDGGVLFGGIEPEIDRFAFGVTIPLGAGSHTTPLNSNTRVARGDYRSAVAAIVNSF